MDNNKRIYINKCKSYIEFMLTQQQWSGLKKEDIERWIKNFNDINLDEEYIIYKLLTNLIYYSESDVLDALKEGVNIRLFYSNILQKQLDSGFQTSQNALRDIYKQELKKSCFIPLLDSNKPHESANYISRQLVQNGMIETTQSMFLHQIVEYDKIYNFTNLIIVDDCVGSGQQLETFWRTATIKDGTSEKLLRKYCSEKNICAKYLTLFGYSSNIQRLSKLFDDLQIVCVRSLEDSLRVFNQNSYIWDSSEERANAIKLFSEYTSQNNVSLYGYNNLDFAFIMHRTIPDWSLPLFWTDSSEWNCLIRRKNSNV